MKKILLLITMGVGLMVLIGCVPKPITESTDLIPLLDQVSNTYSESTLLPLSYQAHGVTWYLNDTLLENGLLPFKYANKDQIQTLKAEITQNGQSISQSKTITMQASDVVNTLYINTENSVDITSKDVYVNGSVNLDAGYFSEDNLLMKIKGRGNSTWDYPKKPYKIKFIERQSLLGMAPAKEYVLLAEYNDKSLIRNYLAQYFTQFLNFDHVMETRYVRVYLNNIYQGLYLLTEQVEVDKNRLNIDESDSQDGGFLIELESDDRIWQEGLEDYNWFKVDGRNFIIQSPDVTDYSNDIVSNKIVYMKDYLNGFLNSIYNGNYADYIDVPNFLDYFILSELFKQVDVGYSSVYSYKDKGGLLKMGPAWDFDISSGNGDYYDSGAAGFWVDYNPWFDRLIDQPLFEMQFVARYNELMNAHFEDLLNEIDFISNAIKFAAEENFTKWQILGVYVWPNPPEMVQADTYAKQITYLKNYLSAREKWLKDTLSVYGYR